jgi:hypothetical protein
MPQPCRPRRGPKPKRRRVLELLAASRDGCTEAIMLAHGFTIDLLVELVRAGLATAKAERVLAAGRAVEVATEDHRGGAASAGVNSSICSNGNPKDKVRLWKSCNRRSQR